ncbi:hypothetical protein [Lentzea roselyniae]
MLGTLSTLRRRSFGRTRSKALESERLDLAHGRRVPAAEVAERTGHTVDVLLKVYAKVLDGQRDRSNDKIDGTLDE